ncbi:hypothetical protein FOZ63_010264, partial [Perkinsus olseni]
SPIGVRFEGASPDEEALVETAASAGYTLMKRNASYVTLRMPRSTPERKARREWHETTFKVLGVNEFTSERKRMSVLVQILKVVETDNGDTTHVPDSVEGDSSMALCGIPVQDVREATVTHIHEFASAGHRTLMLAMRYLDEVETSEYVEALYEARHAITNRADRIARVAAKFERNLIVLGATAVEDKIQRGVVTTVYVSDLCLKCESKMSSEEMGAVVLDKRRIFEKDCQEWITQGRTSRLCVVLEPISDNYLPGN